MTTGRAPGFDSDFTGRNPSGDKAIVVTEQRRSPVVGYNHNILHLGWEFHLQTEDSGVDKAHLITHLFHAGTILATKKLNYDPTSGPEFIKDLMQAQHKAVLRELKAGAHDDKIRTLLGNTPKEAPTTDHVETPAATAATAFAAATPLPTPDAPAPPPPVVAARSGGGGLEWADLIPTSDPPLAARAEPRPPPAVSAPTGSSPSLPPVPPPPARTPTVPPFPAAGAPSTATPSGPPAGWAGKSFKEERTPLPFQPSAPAGGSTYFTTQKVSERVYDSKRPASEPPPRRQSSTGMETRASVPPTGGPPRTEVPLAKAASFLTGYFPHGDAGGYLVSSQLEADLGQPVTLVLRFEDGGGGTPRTVEIKGKVAWKRRRGAGQLKAGTGVEFLAAEKPAVERLLAQAHGRERSAQDRVHSRVRAGLTVKVQHQQKSRKDHVDDISEGGLFILSHELIPVGDEVNVSLKPHSGMRSGVDVRGRVTWHRDGPEAGFGLQFLFDDADHREKVEQVVARIIAEEL
ncbi:MAG: PilZ domain-containing protein [Deltaproteobacteria bacterium]|nr:PilZ domain-containing protein [Deltaproteobacteria bacterium]